MAYDSFYEEYVEGKLGVRKNPNSKQGLKLSYTVERKYVPDFVDEKNKIIYESKGYFKPSDRTKMIAIKKQNPDWQFVLIFQNPNLKLTKAKKSKTYSQWAEANGFQWRAI